MNIKSNIIIAAALILAATGDTYAKGKTKKVDLAANFLKQNDKNKDGVISREESHMGDVTFAKADKNHDGKLDKNELTEHLEPNKRKK